MIETRQVTLNTTTAVQIATPDDSPQHVYIHNQASNNASDVFVGGSAVTITTGLEIPHDSQLAIVLGAGDALFAISSFDAPVVDVLQVKL